MEVIVICLILYGRDFFNDWFIFERVMCNGSINYFFHFWRFVRFAYANNTKASAYFKCFLIMKDFFLLTKSSNTHKQLIRYLLKVIKDKQDTFFHCMSKRTFDVLKLSKPFFAHKVTQQRIQLNRAINPNFNILALIIFWEIVQGKETIILCKFHINKMNTRKWLMRVIKEFGFLTDFFLKQMNFG